MVEILQLVHETSSFPEVLYKNDKYKKQPSGRVLSKDVLKFFAKFIEKHLCHSPFSDKVEGWKLEMFRKTTRS